VLRAWFETQVIPHVGDSDRTPAFDYRAARIYGRHAVPENARSDDAHIAAVAEATRTVKHFQPLGVRVVDPFPL
jgi:hypothetical protein